MIRTRQNLTRRIAASAACAISVFVASTFTAPGAQAAAGGSYVVKEGDTIMRIAARSGISWKALADTNGLAPPYLIVVGDTLRMPAAGAAKSGGTRSTAGASKAPALAATGAGSVVVQLGDTVMRIARRHGVSWKALADANGLSAPYTIVVGRSLKIPSAGGAGRAGGGGGAGSTQPATAVGAAGGRHTVVLGDTLERIGRRTGVPWRQIAQANGIQGPTYTIVVGRTLTIPNGSGTGSAAAKPAAAKPAATGGGTGASGAYTVKAGDNLSRIAKQFGTSVFALAAANGISDPNFVLVGRNLRIVAAPPTGPKPAPKRQGPPTNNSPGYNDSPGSTGIEASLDKWANHYGIDPALVKGLAWVESNWRPHVVSSAGAVGVMQLMPGTAEWLSQNITKAPIDRNNYDQNIHGGTAFLDWLRTNTTQESHMIGSYYQGLGATQKYGLYDQTVEYVRKVQEARKRYSG